MARRPTRRGPPPDWAVATTSEALVMSRSGVEDLLLAYPTIGKRKLERIAPLVKAGGLTLGQ